MKARSGVGRIFGQRAVRWERGVAFGAMVWEAVNGRKQTMWKEGGLMAWKRSEHRSGDGEGASRVEGGRGLKDV